MATEILAVGSNNTPGAWQTAVDGVLVQLFLKGASAAGDLPPNAFAFIQVKDDASAPVTVGRVGTGSADFVQFMGTAGLEYRAVRPGGSAWAVGVVRA